MNNSNRKMAKIPYRISGSGSHVVIFVHGFMDAGGIWDKVIASIEGEDLQKVTLCLLGMGSLSDVGGGRFLLNAMPMK